MKIFGIGNHKTQEEISLKVLDLKIIKLDKTPKLIKSIPNKKQVFDENTPLKQFKSLRNYLRWIVKETKIKLTDEQGDEFIERKYKI